MEMVCVNSAKCPIFNGILQGKEIATKSYKTRYCESGAGGWNTCKRFLVKERYGSCPSDLLPNATLTVEQIGLKYSLG